MFRIVPRSLLIKLGWTTLAYGAVQFLRLVNNVVLSRLLAPPLFGLMLIVNTISTGIELLSDVGINQNIVHNPRGAEPVFYNTAWTLQAIRGLLLGSICFLFSGVVARMFDTPMLGQVLPIFSLIFVFSGLNSTSRYVIQKQMAVARLSVFEVVVASLTTLIHIILALITPTIWALVLGSVFGSAITLIGTFLLVPGMRHQLVLNRPTLRELLLFGRWMFISSMIYFAAMNFDRLYLARHIPLAQLGVFGIARTLADTISLFVARCAGLILFPIVAAMSGSGPEIRTRLRTGRRTMLAGAVIGLALFTAFSDLIVRILYDVRYAEAGLMLPILAIGAWFSLLSWVNDSILIGIGHPKFSAAANLIKLLTMIIGVPIALTLRGLDAAIVILAAAELSRYLTLWVLSRREGLAYARDDLPLTLIFLGLTVLFREAGAALGISGDLQHLFPFAFDLIK